jgi:putative protease
MFAQNLGVKKVILSPELSKTDYLNMPQNSPLPLGIVTNGFFPLSVSRIIPNDIEENTLFTSPKGEGGFIKKSGSNYNIYPNWAINLNDKKKGLEKAGYSFFVEIKEPIPKTIDIKEREGLWNWNAGLK